MWYIAHYGSPLGDITLASDGDALTGLWFLTSSAFDNKVPGSPSGYDGQKHFDSTIGTQATLHAELQVFDNARRWLDAYFAGHPAGTFHETSLRGTPFQRRVWDALLTIPYGHTATYGDIARLIGCRSAQAVGGAIGRNPISIIIPCHRVIGSDGSLTGYAGGINRKRALLLLEQKNYFAN